MPRPARPAALPRRFRRPRLLVVGCGDVGLRVAHRLGSRWRLVGLTHDPGRRGVLRAAGVVPVVGDLDRPATLTRLAGLAGAVLHLAPPAPHGRADPRTAHLLQALARAAGGAPQRLVYVGTTGVYGDAGGERFDETRPIAPRNDRACRRADAERQVRAFGRRHRQRPRVHLTGRCCTGAGRVARRHGPQRVRPAQRRDGTPSAGWPPGTRTTLLRVPGIYALDRPGGDPRERVRRGAPVLVADEDSYTNHVHADDLARACIAALSRGRAQRAVHVCDDGRLKTGDHYDRVADLCGLPRPPRVTRAEAEELLSPMQRSFLAESRRLVNDRLKRELRVRLRYPTVDDALRVPLPAQAPAPPRSSPGPSGS